MTGSTGYAPVNGLQMWYEVHGEGRPLVLFQSDFMLNWAIGKFPHLKFLAAVQPARSGNRER